MGCAQYGSHTLNPQRFYAVTGSPEELSTVPADEGQSTPLGE